MELKRRLPFHLVPPEFLVSTFLFGWKNLSRWVYDEMTSFIFFTFSGKVDFSLPMEFPFPYHHRRRGLECHAIPVCISLDNCNIGLLQYKTSNRPFFMALSSITRIHDDGMRLIGHVVDVAYIWVHTYGSYVPRITLWFSFTAFSIVLKINLLLVVGLRKW